MFNVIQKLAHKESKRDLDKVKVKFPWITWKNFIKSMNNG